IIIVVLLVISFPAY
ncbi:TPA: type I toxin-antitoxin system Ibs family toxin, partial [Escherichia coli]|nr:type I toxin-antitoxin system Ibs family toxin [Escherichia coli]EJH4804910.1 type I toxin-antitoxin system Ibs family toxin [Escherichia coli O145:H28]ELP2926419.1 type I toxin-antitoxin system Ibs family toxin [Escherichia coli O145]HBN2577367.1 type I toxin-antitoxin system Ibs family toxin [Escherichia coli O25b:H4-ST131]EEC8071460.1 type I toxin-antitoxin system Ibs family toxin [Escherichia coli]